MAGFRELMEKRRSIREFEDREVPAGLIEEILADACEAPSGGNRQPWAFSVVADRDMMKRLSDESRKNLLEDMKSLRSPVVRLYRPVLKREDFNVFFNAPCLIYITGPKTLHSAPADCALAASYLMLSAADRGLGTCWVDLGSHIKDPGLVAALGIPEDHRIMATLVLGYPKTVPQRPSRKAPKILAFIR
ncbi:MAG TPA: nitroreductase family protein [Deltaproteobacteria bacterium]|jgi:nitroreductase|nr:nitroreductase family protein [Deltaproteobacteria bacterium]HOI07035.1 nitroreductase family protein [Deltaproteobacteria bacterium]